MSVCDTCRQPGRCCTGFMLPIAADTALELLVKLATMHHGFRYGQAVVLKQQGACSPERAAANGIEHAALGLPFLPLNPVPGGWRLWCPLLGADGRCTEYEHRPALCRDYQPRQDALCAEWTPDPAPEAVELKEAA